jgi:hypothetical protein
VTALRFEPPRGAEAYTDQLDVSTLTERDYVMIRSVLVRTQGMHTQVAAPLAAQALTVVQGRFTPAPPGACPRWWSCSASRRPTSVVTATAPSPRCRIGSGAEWGL